MITIEESKDRDRLCFCCKDKVPADYQICFGKEEKDSTVLTLCRDCLKKLNGLADNILSVKKNETEGEVTSYWITKLSQIYRPFVCKNCGARNDEKSAVCPNCKAKMTITSE